MISYGSPMFLTRYSCMITIVDQHCFRFYWHHTSEILGESLATVTWDIPGDATVGTYRIQHFGYYKQFLDSKCM